MSLHHFGFAAPQYLTALALAPLLVAFAVAIRRRRSRYAVTFTNVPLAASLAAKRRRDAWVPVALLALALAAGAVALARPRIVTADPDRRATIVLLADVSGSMAATDVHPQRIYAAVKAMHAFVDELPAKDELGLIAFSDEVDVLHTPTTDHAAVHSALDSLSPQGGTSLGEAVVTAVKQIVAVLHGKGVRRQNGYLPAAIVLESDGAQDRGDVTPFQAAQYAKAAGVRIYGVSLGSRHGFVDVGKGLLTRSIPVPPSPGTVAMLARETGGQAYNARTAQQVDTVYRGLGSSGLQNDVRREISSWFDLAAAVLLAAGVLALRARAGALP